MNRRPSTIHVRVGRVCLESGDRLPPALFAERLREALENRMASRSDPQTDPVMGAIAGRVANSLEQMATASQQHPPVEGSGE